MTPEQFADIIYPKNDNCEICGWGFGVHRHGDNACPTFPDSGEWRNTSFNADSRHEKRLGFIEGLKYSTKFAEWLGEYSHHSMTKANNLFKTFLDDERYHMEKRMEKDGKDI